MPDRETLEHAQQDARDGKSPSTQAGEFVKEEMDHIREGKHGAASTKQAIAIGQSKRDSAKGQAHPNAKPSPKRSEATISALKKESRNAASPEALARHARDSAKKRGPAARHNAAVKASATRGRLRSTSGKTSPTKRAA